MCRNLPFADGTWNVPATLKVVIPFPLGTLVVEEQESSWSRTALL